jgi:hypothetical protein
VGATKPKLARYGGSASPGVAVQRSRSAVTAPPRCPRGCWGRWVGILGRMTDACYESVVWVNQANCSYVQPADMVGQPTLVKHYKSSFTSLVSSPPSCSMRSKRRG